MNPAPGQPQEKQENALSAVLGPDRRLKSQDGLTSSGTGAGTGGITQAEVMSVSLSFTNNDVTPSDMSYGSVDPVEFGQCSAPSSNTRTFDGIHSPASKSACAVLSETSPRRLAGLSATSSEAVGNEGPQIHHHVHHHLHHHCHHNGMPMKSYGTQHGGSGISVDDVNDPNSFAVWESEYPVLTRGFYDEKGSMSKTSGGSLKENDEVQTRQFFKTKRVLWRGYYCMVLEGLMRASRKKVAIKMIDKKCDAEKRARVMAEHQILYKHSRESPFLVHFHSAFQTQNHCYIVMEFVDGPDLEDRLRTIQFYPQRVAVFYMAEISLAVFYMHQRGIIHRDLRIKNVMFRNNGHIVIIDFGLAKLMAPNAFTRTIVGGLREMPPEMHHGVSYNKSVDYWAMGLILYTLLHGETPFRGKTRVDIFKSVTLQTETYNASLKVDTTVHLCKSLLQKKQKLRLGYEENAEEEMKAHPFFADVVWDRMAKLFYAPPYIPKKDSEDQSGVSETTWPDLAEQNLVFSGSGIPRRLSLAMMMAADAETGYNSLDTRNSIASVPPVSVKAPKRGSIAPVDFTSVLRVRRSLDSHRSSEDSLQHLASFMKTNGDKNDQPKHESLDHAMETIRECTNSTVTQPISPFQPMRLSIQSSSHQTDALSILPEIENTSGMIEEEKITCLSNCWRLIGNAWRIQTATCRAIFCGLENVEPPVVKTRPAVIEYADRLRMSTIPVDRAKSHSLGVDPITTAPASVRRGTTTSVPGRST